MIRVLRTLRTTRKWSGFFLLCGVVFFVLSALPPRARAAEPVVRAILFYSPYCGHCHHVMTEDLPPILEQYADQVEILGIDTTREEGGALYQQMFQQFSLPDERRGVPTLVIGETVLVGSVEIPEQLPGLIEEHMGAGGIDWPPITGLAELLEEHEAQATATALSEAPSPTATPSIATSPPTSSALPASPSPPAGSVARSGLYLPDEQQQPTTLSARLARDPLGNSLAIVVLVGMVAMVGYTAVTFQRKTPPSPGKAPDNDASPPLPAWRSYAIPIISLVGLGVASYLAYVEVAEVSAVCGPVGDCNTVQQSDYARLFGVLPVGVLGAVGYVAIVGAWLGAHYGRGQVAAIAGGGVFALALGGTLFSLYLTFLEPFVIGATCAWCLASSLLITTLLWLSLPLGRQGFFAVAGHR
jgi:uncharacterized membrane protein